LEQIDQYIKQFPEHVQEVLQNIRKLIKINAPEAIELFSYGMPACKIYDKPLVYYAAYKNHIGFYATASGHKKFKNALSQYKQGKGSVQFPINEVIPYKLIEDIIKFRVAENKKKKTQGKRHQATASSGDDEH
jgi:uncharacterized protein YdhG (YjbR/CyaY superfamily)